MARPPLSTFIAQFRPPPSPLPGPGFSESRPGFFWEKTRPPTAGSGSAHAAVTGAFLIFSLFCPPFLSTPFPPILAPIAWPPLSTVLAQFPLPTSSLPGPGFEGSRPGFFWEKNQTPYRRLGLRPCRRYRFLSDLFPLLCSFAFYALHSRLSSQVGALYTCIAHSHLSLPLPSLGRDPRDPDLIFLGKSRDCLRRARAPPLPPIPGPF